MGNDIRNEAYLRRSKNSISLKDIENINNQMKNCVCKIIKGNVKETGFFVKFLFLIVLMHYLF